jgi:hypothetical protein
MISGQPVRETGKSRLPAKFSKRNKVGELLSIKRIKKISPIENKNVPSRLIKVAGRGFGVH